jgi:hypothetical protein
VVDPAPVTHVFPYPLSAACKRPPLHCCPTTPHLQCRPVVLTPAHPLLVAIAHVPSLHCCRAEQYIFFWSHYCTKTIPAVSTRGIERQVDGVSTVLYTVGFNLTPRFYTAPVGVAPLAGAVLRVTGAVWLCPTRGCTRVIH